MKTCMDYGYVITTSQRDDVLVTLTPFSRSQMDRRTLNAPEGIPEDILEYLKTKLDTLYQHIKVLG